MSSPAKDAKRDLLAGLTSAEARLLLLGLASAGDIPKVDIADIDASTQLEHVLSLRRSLASQVDFEDLAQRAGYKTGHSARVMYHKAKRKFFELHAKNDGATVDAVSGDGDAALRASPNGKRQTKRTNAAAGTPAAESDSTPPALGEGPLVQEQATPTPSAKKPRKTPTKRKTAPNSVATNER